MEYPLNNFKYEELEYLIINDKTWYGNNSFHTKQEHSCYEYSKDWIDMEAEIRTALNNFDKEKGEDNGYHL